MASNINPNNINGAYPVAGQDNDSQGFRDNFTNIAINLGYAQNEITDLQNKSILTSPLNGATSTTNTFAPGIIISGGQYVNYTSSATVSQNVNSSNLAIAFATSNVQQFNLTGNTVISAITWNTGNGIYADMRLIFSSLSGSFTLTFPTPSAVLNYVNLNSLASSNTGLYSFNGANYTLALNTGAYAVFDLFTLNNGVTTFVRPVI